MRSITVKLKSGEVRKFVHRGRPGGSYTISVRYENGWAIVEDEYNKQTAFPESEVESVEAEQDYRPW